MRLTIAASALIALAVAQDSQTWDDASAPAAVTTAAQATTTITKTLSLVHTETVYGNSTSASSTVSVASQTSSVAAETTSAGAAPVASGPTGISGAATMSRDIVLAMVAAGAAAFWTL